jgi:3-hydroxyacyl-CoA dehydrogenase
MSTKVAVIGAGFIGRSWSMVFARAGYDVSLYDVSSEALEQAMELLKENLIDLETNKLIGSHLEVNARINVVTDLEEAINGVDWVQENALEKVEIKRELFDQMDRLLPVKTIIASSTSAIPCSEISAGMKGAARMLVAHPANPPYLLPIVELSGSSCTSDDTIKRSRIFLEQVGMEVITIKKETRGFVLNRLQVALLNEAFKLIEDGVVSGEDLDKTLKHGLGLRWSFMGPMETIDLNAPGGIRDYLERFGPSFGLIAEEQSQMRPWDSKKYLNLEKDRRSVIGENELNERAKWRDRRLMALTRHKMEADEEFGK